MHLTTQEVSVENLEVGMYISKLDIPWVQTPFPLQGFFITKQEELNLLAHYCNNVYVDVFRSKVDVTIKLKTTTAKTNQTNNKELDRKTLQLMKEKARFKPSVESYAISSKLAKEVKTAKLMFDEVSAQMANVYRTMNDNGYVDATEVRQASTNMVKSVISNPDALAWLCRLNEEHQDLHQQAVRSAIWSIIFGRHLGLSKRDLRDLGIALLLAPIGKSKLPEELLVEQKTEQEATLYQEHVSLTLEETQKIFSPSHQVNYILSAYCERNDGSGYPKQLVGNRIPFLSRVAGIAEYYEQLINPCNKNEALTPVEATSHLYSLRGSLFQKELVEEFIQAIGIYPTGSLVELSNNTKAIVIEQPQNSRLRPKVAIFKSDMDMEIDKPKVLNLAEAPNDDYGLPLQIKRSLKSTRHEIDAHELHEKLFGGKHWLSFITERV